MVPVTVSGKAAPCKPSSRTVQVPASGDTTATERPGLVAKSTEMPEAKRLPVGDSSTRLMGLPVSPSTPVTLQLTSNDDVPGDTEKVWVLVAAVSGL